MEKHKYLSNFDYFYLQSNALFGSMDCDYTQLEILILAISFEFGH
jgi:hypothetical protein